MHLRHAVDSIDTSSLEARPESANDQRPKAPTRRGGDS